LTKEKRRSKVRKLKEIRKKIGMSEEDSVRYDTVMKVNHKSQMSDKQYENCWVSIALRGFTPTLSGKAKSG